MTQGPLLVLVSCIVVSSAFADSPNQRDIVAIAAGSMSMGISKSEIPQLKKKYDINFPGIFENEIPAHKVSLSDFRIDQYEVTNARFAAFLAANPEWLPANVDKKRHNGHFLESWSGGAYPKGQADHPVVFVTWAAAQSFCDWSGGRLPTEAEWEYVARAGVDQEFPWGDTLPDATIANYGDDELDETTPVGSYPPNDFGVYDLAGNVWEFLYDEWQPEYRNESRTDPVAGGWLDHDEIMNVEGRRTVRGASYGGSVVNLRTRWRDSHVVSNAIEIVGFRCAYAN